MKLVEKTFFLSYRRINLAWALAIFQNSTQHGYDVFFDFKGISSGDLESIILEHVKASALCRTPYPSALERCDNPADWLRREIDCFSHAA